MACRRDVILGGEQEACPDCQRSAGMEIAVRIVVPCVQEGRSEISVNASSAALSSPLVAMSASETIPHQALLTRQDRQAANLVHRHFLGNRADIFVLKTVKQALGHDLPHGRPEFQSGSDGTHRNVAISDVTNQNARRKRQAKSRFPRLAFGKRPAECCRRVTATSLHSS